MLQKLEPEDFIGKAKQIEEKKKKRTIIITSIIVLLVLSYLLYTVLALKKNNDEIIKVKSKNDSLTTHITREDSAKKIIYAYFNFQNTTDTLGILNLLSDTVLRFYLISKPIPKGELRMSKYFEVNQTGKYVIDTNFTVSNLHDTLYSLIKTTSYAGDNILNTLHEIKMNSSYKIVYVRAYDLKEEKVKSKFGIN